jgi:hypothetical protein
MVTVKWIEINKKDQMVGKVKEFKTRLDMDKFIIKLQDKDNFIRIDGISE